MFKYLFLLVLVAACSQKSNTRQVIQNVSSGLSTAATYHDFLDETVEPASEDVLAQYAENPEDVCNTLSETETKDLVNFNEVLGNVKSEVPCAAIALNRIDDFYEEFKSEFNSRALAPKKLETNRIVLDRAYSLPAEKQLPSKVINLTFDDGPHASNTQKVLDILDVYGIKANFFVLGKNAKIYPTLIKSTASRGHSVGGHSMSHASLNKLSFESATREIMGVFDVIESLLGGTDPFFRFPYGARTKALRQYLATNNVSDFFWNVDTLDWKYKDPNYLLKYALNQTVKTGRGIVLFHDIQPQTAAILPAYLNELSNAGYSTVVYEPQ